MTRLSLLLRRLWLNLILGAVLGALALSCFYGPLGPRDLLVLRRHRVQLVAMRNHLFADNAQLAERIARLHSDDAYLQRLIRQQLGYARRDEFVYRFRDRGLQR